MAVSKKSNVGSWWGQTLINIGATFGLGYLAATQVGGVPPEDAWKVALTGVLAPMVGIPIATSKNPDGSPAYEPYVKVRKIK